MTSLTVIIPAYGPGPHLERVVAALQRQIPPVECIIISHSGEGDPTRRFEGVPNVTVLHSPERLYAGAARNRGLALAKTEWVAFIDEDIIVAESWHTALQRTINREGFDCIAGAIGFADSGGYWGMSLWFAEFSSVHAYLATRSVSSGPSANLSIRRKSIITVGGFPEDWATGEELLLQARLHEHGFTVLFDSDVVGDHVNLRGLVRMLRHAYPLGKGSARVRRCYPHLVGALAVKRPLLSLGLWAARMGQICWRVLRSPRGPVLSLLIHLPGILTAVLAWNAGFAREAFLGGMLKNEVDPPS